jgi:predicted class III extradiol MEMO1 family dioxygenase
MKNIAFCTITYGDEYVRLGDTLIKQVNDLGYHIFVMTNDVGHYDQSNEKLMKKDEVKKPTTFDLDAIRAKLKGNGVKPGWVSPNTIKPIAIPAVKSVEEEVEDLIIIKL